MKKAFILIVAGLSLVLLTNCHSSKKATASVHKSTFQSDMTQLVTANCSPCHIPAKGGNKKPFDNYANVKENIDDIIRRIELHPGDRGFMPFRRPRLNDSTILAFKKWKSDGMIEK